MRRAELTKFVLDSERRENSPAECKIATRETLMEDGNTSPIPGWRALGYAALLLSLCWCWRRFGRRWRTKV